MILTPGDVSLAQWRDIYHGAAVTLDPAAIPGIERGAAAVAEILARDKPVYGINTGFGKLATVRIAEADLETLQRNLVLSHAAGVGDPMPIPVARLMMALKLGSLAQGASGVRVETVKFLEQMLAQNITPVIPAQGSVGASGDLAPLAHMAAVMIGTGEVFCAAGRLPATEGLAQAGMAPLTLGPKEGLALLNGTQFSTAYALAGLFEAERLVSRRFGHRRALHRRGARFGCTVRCAYSRTPPPQGAGRGGGRAARSHGGQRHPRLAYHRR